MNKTTPIIVIAIVAVAVVVGFLVSKGGKSQPDMANTIAIIPETNTGTFWQLVLKGAEKAAEGTDYKVGLYGPASPNDVAQKEIMENLVGQGVAGFVIAPVEINALLATIEQAADANIPSVLICSRDVEPGGLLKMGPDEYIAGVMAARSLGRALGEAGRIVAVNYDQKSGLAGRCEAGFADTIKNEFAKIQVVRAIYGGPTADSALEATREVLMRDPTVTGLFASRESTSVGALKAIQGQGLEGKVKMVGFGTDKVLVDALKSGTVVSLISRNPYKMGYEAAKSVISRLGGAPVELVPYVDTGLKPMTAANLTDPEVQNLLPTE